MQQRAAKLRRITFALPLHLIICIFAFMKFLAIIFSIYILALNFMPCEDNGTFDNNVNIEISQVTNIDHGHNVLDLCSPFCQCHCCHIHATYFNWEEFKVASQNISIKIFSRFEGLSLDYSTSILQPPRV